LDPHQEVRKVDSAADNIEHDLVEVLRIRRLADVFVHRSVVTEKLQETLEAVAHLGLNGDVVETANVGRWAESSAFGRSRKSRRPVDGIQIGRRGI